MTATTDVLTQQQIAQLQNAYDQAMSEDQNASGVWAPVYELLYGFLTTTGLNGLDEPRVDVPVDRGTWLWIKGARFVNANEGAFGTLIRDYTVAQYEQRYGLTPAASQMNEASNQIAQTFIGQWLGVNPVLGASQPTLLQTGLYDAGAAASTVFGEAGGTDDQDNAAGWAGTILFSNLGEPGFYRDIVLDGLLNPSTSASYQIDQASLNSVDLGSYDAVAAAAAVETFARDHILNVPTLDESAAFLRQLFSGGFFDNLGLQAEVNAAFWALYGLTLDDPRPEIGNDSLGSTGWQTVINATKDAHYVVGSKEDDTIGYKIAGNGAYATASDFWGNLLGSVGLNPTGDVINAGRGNDKIYGTSGSDILDGGEDHNTLIYLPPSWFEIGRKLSFSFDGRGLYLSRTIIDKSYLFGIATERDIAVQFDKIIVDFRSMQTFDAGSPSGRTEAAADSSDAAWLEIDLTSPSIKDGDKLKRSEIVKIHGDVGQTRGAYVDIDLGENYTTGLNQDVIDAGDAKTGIYVNLTTGSVVGLNDDTNISGRLQWLEKLAGALVTPSAFSIKNANSVIGTQYSDILIANGNGDESGEGLSTLYGGAGNDLLVGAGKEARLYGGSGGDSFLVGSNARIEDGEIGAGDATYFAGIQLTGGVKQWWMEGNTAYWAPFTSLSAAFPVIGSELITTAAILIDAVTMKFAQYQITADGALAISLAWGLAGTAYVKNYSVDFNSGVGTAGITVFQAESGGGKHVAQQRINSYVNLALYAGFGHGLGGYDPLVLDLNGDGYNLVAEDASSAYFEFDADGFGEHAGWVRGTDGFLVRDANANGKIDNVSEMFGNESTGGFDVLASYDANLDGKIDASDGVFSGLSVWQDYNQNGVTDTGELKSLSELGIVSISLSHSAPSTSTVIGGNTISQVGSFTRADGSTGGIADVLLGLNETNSRWLGDSGISTAAAALPQLAGFGEIKDLRVAMTSDTILIGLVEDYVELQPSDLGALEAGAEDILYHWAGVDGVVAQSLGSDGFDTRKLAFLEKYTGYELMARNTSGELVLDNLDEVESLWEDQLTRLTLRLAVQGPLAADFSGITYNADRDLLVASTPTALGDLLHGLLADLPGDPAAAAAQWANWAPLLGALTESMVRFDANIVRGDYVFAQLVAAMDGVSQPLSLQQLSSALGISNVQIGSASNETLFRAASGTAIFYSGGGDDVLNGGGGQDVYVFGRRIGHSTINDAEARESGDRIRFAFLNRSDVSLARSGTDLLITVTATGETVTVTDQFANVTPGGADLILSTNKGVEDIQFADGTVMEIPQIMVAVGTGTDGDDHLVGTMHSDALTGGKGNDLLEGGDDADLYVVNAGDGQDIIRENQTSPLLRAADMVVFGDDIAPEDLIISRVGASGSDLLFTIGSSGQSLLIQNQFTYTSLGYEGSLALNSRIEAFAFREYGDSWSYKDIQQKLIAQATTSEADTTRGFGGDDTFAASAGDDILVGMDGADTYNWSKDSGNDTIDEQALYIDVEVGLGGINLTTRADKVQFSSGMTLQDLAFKRDSSAPDLTITILSTGQTLTVKNQFAGIQTGVLGAQWFNRVEWFQLADGSRLSWQDVEAMVTTGGDGNDSLYGDILADQMIGGEGNDILSGGGGGDTYLFNAGDGHDTLSDNDTSFLSAGFLTVDGSPDILQFGSGITPGDVQFGRNGADVDLIIGSSGDRVTLKGQDTYIYTGVFGNLSSNRIEEVHFADGTIWGWQDLNERIIAAATTSGNDITLGTSTNDIFQASAGDDIIDGADGSDVYAFGRGSGHDIIRDRVDNMLNGSADKLAFGAGISLADLVFSRAGDDLIITISDTGDSIRIEQQFHYDAWFTWHQIEEFQFEDGSTLTNSDVQAILLAPTAGNDTITGFGSDDLLDGSEGDDTLIGGDGSDTYIFGIGYGHDTIQETVRNTNLGSNDTIRFGYGVAPGDIAFSRTNNDLIMKIGNTSDMLTVAGYFDQSAWFTWNAVENFVFEDGTIWNSVDVAIKLLAGTTGDDVLIGTIADDNLDGGAGNDALTGGDGSDTYIFGRGYGKDTITEWVSHIFLSNEDRVVFNADVSFSDVRFSRFGNNLVISINGTEDSLTVYDQFALNGYFSWTDIERFEFSDGTIVTQDDLTHVPFVGTSGNDQMIGTSTSDTMQGREGDDYLAGGAGDDIYLYNTGDGEDRIRDYGGAASDKDMLSLLDLTPSEVELRRNGNHLYVGDLGTGHEISIEYQFNDGGFEGIEEILFADGTIWDRARILEGVTDSATGKIIIKGTLTDDSLTGTSSSDIIEGRTGNDYLTGGGSDDTYVYSAGDGNDHIWDYNGGTIDNDTLKFTDLSASDVQLRREGIHLYIKILTTGQEIWVEYFYHSTEEHAVENIEFSDGTRWDKARIHAEAWSFGTTAGERIDGTSGSNKIQGNGGDDYLVGGAGDDLYVYRSGDGSDRIYDYNAGATDSDTLMLGDLNVENVDLSRSGDHLYIKDLLTEQEICIEYYFHSSGQDAVENIKFADGTIWNPTRVLQEVAGHGTAASERIDGTAGADIFRGERGDDYLIGGAGDDIYVYHSGDGNDHIYDYNAGVSDTDTLKLADLNPADVKLRRVGDHLYVKDKTTGQEIWIEYHFYATTQGAVEQIQFADGTIWNLARIKQEAALEGTAAGETLDGTSGSETLQGNGGDDLLRGGVGDDVYLYRSGDGNDHIWDYNAGNNDTDTLKLIDLGPNDVELRRSGDHLYVKDLTNGQEIWIEYHFHYSTQDAVEHIEFADGTIWDQARILQEVGGAGTAASERIDGTSGADILQGKGGDDFLVGWAGDDSYVYRSGDGNDHIYDYNGGVSDTDTLKLVDLNPNNVELRRLGDHLYVKDLTTGQEIWIEYHFYPTTQGAVERIQFADGTVWDTTRIQQEAWYRGTAAGETIDGTGGADTIIGRGGDDTLRGSQGNDVYIYSSGDGNDIIYDYNAGVTDLDVLKFTNLNPEDLIFRRSGDHLFIKDKVTGQEIQGLYQFHSSNQDMVESIQFANGTVWSATRIQQEAAYRGTAGNDSLSGTASAEVFEGNGGNDYLAGGAGDDTYIYRSGDGSDHIWDYNAGASDTDTLKLVDLNPGNVELRRSGDHLYVKDLMTGQEIWLEYHFYSDGRDIVEQIQFADGTIWNAARISAVAATSGNDLLLGSAQQDWLRGLDGNDGLTGLEGNDFLDGGAGSDTANFRGVHDDYTIATVSGAISITDDQAAVDGDDGVDILSGIETASFKDGSYSLAAPIVLDLDGNGVALVDSDKANIRFDWNGDGHKDQTGWIGKGDGFLFIDRDGNGTVTNGGELSFTSDRAGAKSDLDGLKAFDSNHDGALSPDDDQFTHFKVWRDGNGNGRAERREILSLQQAGVASIGLSGEAVNQSWQWGENITVNHGAFTRTDGTEGAFSDVALSYDVRRSHDPSIHKAASQLSEAIAAFWSTPATLEFGKLDVWQDRKEHILAAEASW